MSDIKSRLIKLENAARKVIPKGHNHWYIINRDSQGNPIISDGTPWVDPCECGSRNFVTFKSSNESL